VQFTDRQPQISNFRQTDENTLWVLQILFFAHKFSNGRFSAEHSYFWREKISSKNKIFRQAEI